MTAIHAVATADPQQLRWVLPPGHRLPAGIVRRAPGPLGDWLEHGEIAELVIRGTDAWITLGAENSWRAWGDAVGKALQEALQQASSDPAGWQVDQAGAGTALAEIVEELLAGPVGALTKSHGGAIELVSVDGDTVTVRTSGACDGCPASGSTLYDTLQRELRRRAGDQVSVVRAPARRAWLRRLR